MQLKAVFFDLDDTLYGEFPVCDQTGLLYAGQYVAEHLGIHADQFIQAMCDARESLRKQLPNEPEIHDRVLFAQTALESFGINPIPHAAQLHNIYWQGVFDTMKIRDGVSELLQDLHTHNICVVVCTNMLAGVQMQKLNLLGIAENIDFLVTSEEAGKDKPDSPIFQLALKKAHCLPEEALMVGDSFLHDIEGAAKVGIAGLWLHLPHMNPPINTNNIPYQEASTFLEVAAQIKRYMKGL